MKRKSLQLRLKILKGKLKKRPIRLLKKFVQLPTQVQKLMSKSNKKKRKKKFKHPCAGTVRKVYKPAPPLISKDDKIHPFALSHIKAEGMDAGQPLDFYFPTKFKREAEEAEA